MATRIAWWLNLDAAFELERGASYAQNRGVAKRVQGLAARMQTLVMPQDVVLDGSLTKRDLPGYLALPFCNTPSALSALSALGFATPPAPPAAVLRELTRRAFCARLGQTLPGAAYVESLAALQACIDRPSFSGEWLLKRDFSFAGRERRRVRENTLDRSTLGFAKRSFALGQGLQVEPYVQREADFAQHGYVTPHGSLLLTEPLLQHCDVRGVWQASEALPLGALSESERALLRQAAEEAGEALHDAGYVGPYGLDAFRYRGEHGLSAFQPRSEVNVRFSMGYPRALLDQALAREEPSENKV